MEITALKLAASVVSPLVTKLGEITYPHFGGDITDEDFRNLQEDLTKIQAVLAAADYRIDANDLSPWLKDLRTAAYEIEDVINMYEYKRRSDEVSSLPPFLIKAKHKAKSFFAPILPKTKLKKCMEKLQPFATKAEGWKGLLIQRDEINVPRLPSTVSSSSSPIFGRDQERDSLVGELISSPNSDEAQESSSSSFWRIPILAIHGIGGAGKTTFAQYIFNDQRIIKHFHSRRLWIDISRKLDVSKATKNMIELVKGACPSLESLQALQTHLKKHLKESDGKFLVILDDVWLDEAKDVELFNQLLIPFNEVMDKGSRVLITTRAPRTASLIRARPVRLEELTHEACLSIVQDYVGKDITDPTLVQVLHQIVSNLQGSPLAARIIGAQLGAMVDVREWENVTKGDILRDTRNVLLWSYKRLPTHLQQCFAFCSLFPKGWEFDDLDELVRLWIAQGYVMPDNKCKLTLEDLGRKYFNDLLSFSFFKPHPDSSNSYVIHDLLHDLAEQVSERHIYKIEGDGDKSKSIPDGDGDKSKSIPETVIHLSVHTKEFTKHLPDIFKLVNLRTLIFTFQLYSGENIENGNIINKIFGKLSKLRVLCLGPVQLKEQHSSIGNLKHLQYLQLRLDTKLPKALGTLYHLKFLDLRESSVESLPEGLNDLMNLRCLLVDNYKAPMMPEVGKLKSLNTLNVYPVSKKRGHEIGQLKNLNLRGALEICGLENVKDTAEAVEARLKDKKLLVELFLKWTGDSSEVDNQRDAAVLEGLEPPSNIKRVSIVRYSGVVSPSWLLSGQRCLPSLQCLRLSGCSKWKELPPLGQLPSLVTLKIENGEAVEDVGPNFYYTRSGGNSTVLFSNLKSLLFKGMENWTRWSLPSCGVEGVQLFPCLSKLTIKDCPKLTGIPFLPPSLCELEIQNCPGLKMELSAPSFPRHLKRLDLRRCKGTETLISEMMSSSSSSSLESLHMWNCSTPAVMSLTCPSSLTSVTKIEVMFCESLTSLVLADHMKALLSLDISDCKNLRSIEGIESLPSLKELAIRHSPMLMMSVEPVVYHVSCESVLIERCPNLTVGRRSAGGEVHRRSSIKSLYIDDPALLEEMSPHITSLSGLSISSCSLSSLPVNLLSNFSSLKKLDLWDCPELESLPNLPTSLEKLLLHCYKNIQSLPVNLLSSLKELQLYECPGLESLPNLPTSLEGLELSNYENIQSLPVNRLSSLKVLKISYLSGIESLPDLGNLSSLEKLKITWCPKIESLPNLPPSLAELSVWGCHPKLKAKYKRGGPLHHQIAHIPELLEDLAE